MEKGTHRDPYITHNTLLLCRCYQMAHRPTNMTVKSLSLHPVSSKYFRNTGTLAFMLLLHYSAIYPKATSQPSGQDIQLVVCSYPSHPDREEAESTLGGSDTFPIPATWRPYSRSADSPRHLPICPNQQIHIHFMTYHTLNTLINSTSSNV